MNESAQPAPQRLRTSVGVGVGVGGTAVIAMANTAPTLNIGIGLGLISLDVGAAVPAMVLLAVLPVLGIALAFSRRNRSERNLGASYPWVGRTLNPWLGLGGFLAVSDWQAGTGFALNAQNGRFLAVVPLAVVAVGLALSAWAKWVRRSPYFLPGGSRAGDFDGDRNGRPQRRPQRRPRYGG